MPNGESPAATAIPNAITDRIGPIVDFAFLRILPKDKLREITAIRMRAQLRIMQTEAEAMQEALKAVESVEF